MAKEDSCESLTYYHLQLLQSNLASIIELSSDVIVYKKGQMLDTDLVLPWSFKRLEHLCSLSTTQLDEAFRCLPPGPKELAGLQRALKDCEDKFEEVADEKEQQKIDAQITALKKLIDTAQQHLDSEGRISKEASERISTMEAPSSYE